MAIDELAESLAHLVEKQWNPLAPSGVGPHPRRTTMSNAYRAEEPDLPHANDELMTMKEVAALVRVPEATLRYWRHLGKGPRGFRVGRSVRYWRTEVALCLEEQSRHPQDEI